MALLPILQAVPCPPSGLRNRVLIAIQNPSSAGKGALAFVDAFYDVRFSYNSKTGSFGISGFGGALPVSIQNFPEEQAGLVYSSGDGTLVAIDYSQEKTNGSESGLNGLSASVFEPRNRQYIFAASQASQGVFHGGGQDEWRHISAESSGVYRTSVNIGGSVALAFVQNSDYVYYPRKLTAAQTVTYAGGPQHMAKGSGGLRTAECARLVPVPGTEPPTIRTQQATSTVLR